jgi:superfamily II DNA helicase RecQ
VIFTVVPLLSISADQATKLPHLQDTDTSVRVYNLDAIRNFRANQRIRRQLLDLDDDTALTIFLFCSPQKITKDAMWSDTIQTLVVRGILRLVAVDECHLFANFGIEFWAECYHLKEHLFSKLHLAPINIPIVFMTATATSFMVDDLELLCGIQFNKDHDIFWPSDLCSVRRRNLGIQMNVHTTPLVRLIFFIRTLDIASAGEKMILYTNSLLQCK